jgi:hypothetical protein
VSTQTGVLIMVRVTYRNRPGAKFAGALWQDSRLVFQCDHEHGWQGAAKSCADGTADRWPGRERTLYGPSRAPVYKLPWLPDIRRKA